MSIYICGDLHGSPQAIRNVINQISNPTEEDKIIVCGDAGFEYQDYFMGQAKKIAKKFPGTWIVMRGNHDSSYWNKHAYWDKTKACYVANNGWAFTDDSMYLYQKKYPNIWYVADGGGIYNIDDYTFLFVPGAYSVDKYYRLRNNYPWNPDEQLSTKEWNDLYRILYQWIDYGFSIDFVIGHTFPYKLQPRIEYLFMEGLDQSKIDKTTEHWLDDLSDLYENVPEFKHYFGGHFHDDRQLTNKYTMLYHTIVNLNDYIEPFVKEF